MRYSMTSALQSRITKIHSMVLSTPESLQKLPFALFILESMILTSHCQIYETLHMRMHIVPTYFLDGQLPWSIGTT